MSERKLNVYACIVCGQGIWWKGDLPPACNHHNYKQVHTAAEKRTKRAERAIAKAKTKK